MNSDNYVIGFAITNNLHVVVLAVVVGLEVEVVGKCDESVVTSRCIDLPHTLSVGRVVARESLTREVSPSAVEDPATTCRRTIIAMAYQFRP